MCISGWGWAERECLHAVRVQYTIFSFDRWMAEIRSAEKNYMYIIQFGLLLMINMRCDSALMLLLAGRQQKQQQAYLYAFVYSHRQIYIGIYTRMYHNHTFFLWGNNIHINSGLHSHLSNVSFVVENCASIGGGLENRFNYRCFNWNQPYSVFRISTLIKIYEEYLMRRINLMQT